MTEEQAIELLNPRHRKFYEMRKAGATFSSIGKIMKVCAGRARQVFFSSQRQIEALVADDDGWVFLSVRAKNCLLNCFEKIPWGDEFKVSKSEVKEAITSGRLDLLRYRNLGKETAKEIRQWVGIPKTCSCCGQVIQL